MKTTNLLNSAAIAAKTTAIAAKTSTTLFAETTVIESGNTPTTTSTTTSTSTLATTSTSTPASKPTKRNPSTKPFKRKIDLIVIHCSATRCNTNFTPEALDACHRKRGFNGCGYHFYITKDGLVHDMRPVEIMGAHARRFNAHSIGMLRRWIKW